MRTSLGWAQPVRVLSGPVLFQGRFCSSAASIWDTVFCAEFVFSNTFTECVFLIVAYYTYRTLHTDSDSDGVSLSGNIW